MKVRFMDLGRIHEHLWTDIDARIKETTRKGDFILGGAVEEFEKNYAKYIGTKHAVAVSSGTDALELILRSYGIGEGDEVLIPGNTFIATAGAVSFTGATPVPVDVDSTYNIDGSKLKDALTIRTRAIMPVHLYGKPANMDLLKVFADVHELTLIEDACQAHGAIQRGKRCGNIGDAGAFSFYPAKNLGAFGDAGIVTTNDDAIAENIRMLRNYGQKVKYHHDVLAFNKRMDTLQAVVLNAKLPYLDAWNESRRQTAKIYTHELSDVVNTPRENGEGLDCEKHVYHLYVIRHPARDRMQAFLKEQGIDTGIHYPIPIHKQQAYSYLKDEKLPNTERFASEILSLPMFPDMTQDEVGYVIDKVKEFCKTNGKQKTS